MIFNVGAGGGASTADKVKYDNTESGLQSDNVQGAVDELNSSLTNEYAETFNFGVKDGVRGFFTNPSRADDSFVPFKRVTSVEIQTWNLTGDGIYFRAKLYYNDNTVKVLFDGILKTNSKLTYNA